MICNRCQNHISRKADDECFERQKKEALKELLALKEEIVVSVERENLTKKARSFLSHLSERCFLLMFTFVTAQESLEHLIGIVFFTRVHICTNHNLNVFCWQVDGATVTAPRSKLGSTWNTKIH